MTIRLPVPLFLPPSPPPEPKLKISDILPSRDPLPTYPVRDACIEFKEEVANIVKTILTEYESLKQESEVCRRCL